MRRGRFPTRLCCCAMAAMTIAWPRSASGGNIILTGHDDDHHYAEARSAAALAQIKAMVALARAGAPDPELPVLVFDQGTQLTRSLNSLYIPIHFIDFSAGAPDPKLFDVKRFSAIAVASDSVGGCGCDNDATAVDMLGKARDSIRTFVNAGGGLLVFAGGTDAGKYYGFLPATVFSPGMPDKTGYEQTPAGKALGIPEVNGDPTHNFFAEPGHLGEDPRFQVVERYSGTDLTDNSQVKAVPATLAFKDARIGAGGFERPISLAGSKEGLMEATTLVVSFALLAFMVERLTNGLAIVLGYWPWWRSRMEVVSGADPLKQAAIERNRRVGLFAMSSLLAVGGAIFAKLNLLAQLGATATPELAGYLVTGLLVAAGADPIREALNRRGSRDTQPPPPIQVSGTLLVRRDPDSESSN
jgi:hypothetical protein